tara:strand:+ start:631 stop:1005 length:375 start_codon:yes stop_codon:yes gene_type:complete
MATKPANAAQKKWMSIISEWAIENIGELYGDEWSGTQFQLHHVMGRSAKQDKVEIGHWFILPVPFALHDVSSNHLLNVTHHKKSFVRKFGNQSEIFNQMLHSMWDEGLETPSFDINNAIGSTGA